MLTSTLFRRALVALLLAVPLVATGGTAQAAACSGSSGVTVIVQFPDGHTETGCAPGDPSSGKAALDAAGFASQYTIGQPFVCKIKLLPENATCHGTPPANAYWAYFHAERGGRWSYNSQGAASSNPAPGSVEGWSFGSGASPSTPPPPATSAAKPKPKPAPAPKPTTKPTPGTRPSPTGGSTAQGSARPSATPAAAAKATKQAKQVKTAAQVKTTRKAAESQRKAAKATKAKTKKASAKPSTSVSATPTSQPTDAVAAPVNRSGPTPNHGGGNVPWLWGLIGLVAVGGAAGAVTLARRR